MSNSQEQSLDEDAMFLPVTESSPDFLHCERERHALETLMRAGRGAFYTCLTKEHLGFFLSPEEVDWITGRVQDHQISQSQLEEKESAEDSNSGAQDFSVCYFPTHSDTPAPCLELGWPEKRSWMGMGRVTVHTSPPAEGQPHIREIIRRHLQGACQVIAIVTDSLTDGAVIGDLHSAASRGVPVYIILNQRSIQENFNPNRLRHPNMQVRVLGGKTVCSRDGRKMVGEMKDKFLLVDLETVIHGSYSLTWTDAHLHRQLITVLNGPVVESFDQEFRILFAASSPVPDTWRAAVPPADAPYQLNDPSDLCWPKRPTLEPLAASPPPPLPAESPLDWEALGVFHRDNYDRDGPVGHQEKLTSTERQLFSNTPFEKKTLTLDKFSHNRNRLVDEERIGHKIQRAYCRQVSAERTADSEDRTLVRLSENRRQPDSRPDTATLTSTQKRERSLRDNILEEGIIRDETGVRAEGPSSRKPLILRVPQCENFSSLSDIIRRLQTQPSSSAQHERRTRTTVSELSRSMMDLSIQNTHSNNEERGAPAPRLLAKCFDPGHMTPAFALMRQRTDEVKPALYRSTTALLTSSSPRSSSFGLQMDWRRPQTGWNGWHEELE
ncbi:protein FAM83E [Lampris incognitus]|uniref:protein FAM83E n=1 Tax=Lampris incognitus TaxID=2546036 RepID=UPI0024B617D2|nr:protein FAM83E [Lampris incognitus]